MSFDIHFSTCRFRGEPIQRENPFTKEVITINPLINLTDEEMESVTTLLQNAAVDADEDEGFYAVSFEDGGHAEVFASDLASGCMVALRGLTPDLGQFLFEMVNAANWVMIPVMEDSVAVKSEETEVESLPEGFPKIVVCNSAKEIGELLSGGVAAWQKYRDQVVEGDE